MNALHRLSETGESFETKWTRTGQRRGAEWVFPTPYGHVCPKGALSTARPRPSVASVTAVQSGQEIKTIAPGELMVRYIFSHRGFIDSLLTERKYDRARLLPKTNGILPKSRTEKFESEMSRVPVADPE